MPPKRSMILQLFCLCFQVEIESVISNTPEWQSWPGYAMLAFRLIVMVWFLLQLRHTYGNTDREDLSFVMHFGAFSLVWFSYLPALALITTQVSPLWRYKTILSEFSKVHIA